jgi:hypothetical protein
MVFKYTRSENMKLANMGEFIKELNKRGTQFFVDQWVEWIEDSTKRQFPGRWEELAGHEVDERYVLMLAKALQTAISMEADHWSTPEPNADTLDRGHKSLKLLHQLSAEVGLDIPIGQIDVSLSFAEMMIDSGVAQAGPNNTIQLSDEARDTCERMDARLRSLDQIGE